MSDPVRHGEEHAPSADQVHPPSRRRSLRLVLLIAVPLLVGLVSALVYLKGGRYVETDNAYVKADKVPLGAEVSGTIIEVLVDENEQVRANQLLFRLDRAPFELAVARAKARLAQTRTELSALRASYRAKQAEIALAQTRRSFALKDQQRQADLASRNFISPSRLDEARENADIAAQQIRALEEDLKRIAETLGGSVDAAIESHPSYLAAAAELHQAQLDLARTEVRAPLPGTISRPPKPGQYSPAGAMAVTLVADDTLRIEANFPETDLTWVRPGQPATVRIDTFPDLELKGRVESLSPATGSEFSVIPAQNATGNWVKISQRVPVRIALDSDADLALLRAGLSAEVSIDTGHRRTLLGLSLPGSTVLNHANSETLK
jgi:membrane fusion protein (multidrug efflux system)